LTGLIQFSTSYSNFSGGLHFRGHPVDPSTTY